MHNRNCRDQHNLDFRRVRRGICYFHVLKRCSKKESCRFTHQLPPSITNDPQTVLAAKNFLRNQQHRQRNGPFPSAPGRNMLDNEPNDRTQSGHSLNNQLGNAANHTPSQSALITSPSRYQYLSSTWSQPEQDAQTTGPQQKTTQVTGAPQHPTQATSAPQQPAPPTGQQQQLTQAKSAPQQPAPTSSTQLQQYAQTTQHQQPLSTGQLLPPHPSYSSSTTIQTQELYINNILQWCKEHPPLTHFTHNLWKIRIKPHTNRQLPNFDPFLFHTKHMIQNQAPWSYQTAPQVQQQIFQQNIPAIQC